MNDHHIQRSLLENDPLLAPFIEAQTADERDEALEAIHLHVAEPLARRVLMRFRSTLTEEDIQDVVSTVHLRLARKLRALLAVDEEPVATLAGYVATLAFNTTHDHLRQRFPERSRLKNRTRYLMKTDPRFAVWNAEAGSVCGLQEWKGRTDIAAASALDSHTVGHGPAAEEISALLKRIGRPVMVDHFVDVLAQAWGISDQPPPDTQPEIAHTPSIAQQVESRQYLSILWSEIQQLRPNQRVALLLNLRDSEGSNAVAHIVYLGIATFDEVAAALEMAPVALAARWNDLPLDDLTIAEMLGVKRQNVINLRKAARERLARRMPA